MTVNWYIIAGLFVAFFVLEFVNVRSINSIVEKKVLKAGLYAFIGWTIYLFGIYEMIDSIYNAIPSIIGATLGTMAAVHLKKLKDV